MSEEEFSSKARTAISQHVAMGRPVIIAAHYPLEVGQIMMMTVAVEPLGMRVDIQNVRIIRPASREEYLAAMPQIPGADPTWCGEGAFCYEVESD